jgi:endogenous inhibitor of DNA gyrase (YacG/DUF329 family)
MKEKERTTPCPICDTPVPLGTGAASRYLPFCSERCRTIDLGRWYGEGYSVPVETRRLAEELLEEVHRESEEIEDIPPG